MLSCGIVLFSLLIGTIISLGYIAKTKETQLSERSMVTAQLVAQLHTVQEAVTERNAADILQPLAQRIRIINNDDYIIILNMDKIRLTHPNRELLMTPFQGGDEDAAFNEHIYISKAKAREGLIIRAFVPILNERNEQVGVVVVGNRLPTIPELIGELGPQGVVVLVIALAFGLWGAWILASHIKERTFNMEPEELARTLQEKTATFNAINEGIIAIDAHERITVINDVARHMLGVRGAAVGLRIGDVIPDTRLPEVLQLDEPLLQREFYIQNRLVFSNRIPIKEQGKTIGAVAIFQDKTEVTRLATELTGIQSFVDALRVQNHEYANKLHTIAGLIQLNLNEKALQYIFDLSQEQAQVSQLFRTQIRDESIAGLLLGKISRGNELDVTITVDADSSFTRYPEGIDRHDIVVILGNLIDNAVDAVHAADRKEKKVIVYLGQADDELIISVQDNGKGVDAAVKETMFVRGVSTKAKNGRGIGLFLVKAIVDRVEGDIEMESSIGKGTTISVRLPMWRKRGERDGGGHPRATH